MRSAALARAVRRGFPSSERREQCALCGLELAEQHRHVLDVEAARPACVCQACSLLFDRPEAAKSRFRPLPRRRQRVEGFDPASLGIPVGLAFVVVERSGTPVARYPSPAGATRWELDASRSAALVAAQPFLAALEPEVEALLVDSGPAGVEAFIVPLDDCYRLVAAVRLAWEGLAGGARVRPAVQSFFEELRRSDGTHQSR